MLVNAAREGLGCTVTNQVVDMAPFYFEGINVAGEVPDGDKPATNTTPVGAIKVMVDVVVLFGEMPAGTLHL